jgi:hypothetical protein
MPGKKNISASSQTFSLISTIDSEDYPKRKSTLIDSVSGYTNARFINPEEEEEMNEVDIAFQKEIYKFKRLDQITTEYASFVTAVRMQGLPFFNKSGKDSFTELYGILT